MESEREQLLYGDVCHPHRTPIGTAGGADFMCHYCEMGMNTWVDDPTMELRLILDMMAYPVTIATFQASNAESKWEQMCREFLRDNLWTHPDTLEHHPVWSVREVSSGYWSE